MNSFFLSRLRAFRYAFRGWWYVIRSQQNAWVHAVISTAVFIVSLWLGLSPRDWAVIILTIAMVWMAEFLNTSIEAVVDLASPSRHPLAEVGKDVGAAAVLIAALASVGIGLLILGPPLWAKVTPWLGQSSAQVSSNEHTAFKGMELYSWQGKNGEWQYAVLLGTNRNKSLQEIQAAVLDLQHAKQAISQLATGESLYWITSVFDIDSNQMVTLKVPPKEIVRELQAVAREKQINLFIP